MGFVPVGDHIFVEAEPVVLQEPSYVLEILFQFIEPPPESRDYRQPDVDDLSRDLFFMVAEAAEKYVVYSAINVCICSMRYDFITNDLLQKFGLMHFSEGTM